MVKTPPCNAGDMGSILDQGSKILHTPEQLSLLTTTEPMYSGACVPESESVQHSKRSHDAVKILYAATKI